MSKTFVIGDIHGAYRALKQCLERSQFDYEKDHLICLGDVCDGWPDTKESIQELLKIKHLTYILGNHDYWMLEWMKHKQHNELWERQGGAATIASYAMGIPQTHVKLMEQALDYYILQNKLFVHAGIALNIPLAQQDQDIFLWDRTMATLALSLYDKNPHNPLTDFDEVYLGHTPTVFGKPIQSCEVWLMDTGAGWSGVLSIMDIDTKHYFTSDPVPSLYPGIEGRKKKHP